MSLTNKRIKTFTQLGTIFNALATEVKWPGFELGISKSEFSDGLQAVSQAVNHNGWFTPESVKNSLLSWSSVLTEDELKKWTNSYELDVSNGKTVGLIAAGNIPMVSLHDIISVLISGNKVLLKLSSKDQLLMMMVINFLKVLDPELTDYLNIVQGKLEGFDAVIATGSNNSSRYFEYYFKDKPSIIRKNRTSVAVLTGEESEKDLVALAKDIFSYYGLGCRNVTKIYVPEGYNLDLVFNALYHFKDIANHNKYANNYDYHRAIWLLNGTNLLENGFILLKEDESLVSPVGTLFYEFYKDEKALRKDLEIKEKQIQCIVSKTDVDFGMAQKPGLTDYADGVDTLAFLVALQ